MVCLRKGVSLKRCVSKWPPMVCLQIAPGLHVGPDPAPCPGFQGYAYYRRFIQATPVAALRFGGSAVSSKATPIAAVTLNGGVRGSIQGYAYCRRVIACAYTRIYFLQFHQYAIQLRVSMCVSIQFHHYAIQFHHYAIQFHNYAIQFHHCP